MSSHSESHMSETNLYAGSSSLFYRKYKQVCTRVKFLFQIIPNFSDYNELRIYLTIAFHTWPANFSSDSDIVPRNLVSTFEAIRSALNPSLAPCRPRATPATVLRDPCSVIAWRWKRRVMHVYVYSPPTHACVPAFAEVYGSVFVLNLCWICASTEYLVPPGRGQGAEGSRRLAW